MHKSYEYNFVNIEIAETIFFPKKKKSGIIFVWWFLVWRTFSNLDLGQTARQPLQLVAGF